VLQLRPQNIKVIGGEVESLLQTNSVEAILREALYVILQPVKKDL
jgi:hypothetical protein